LAQSLLKEIVNLKTQGKKSIIERDWDHLLHDAEQTQPMDTDTFILFWNSRMLFLYPNESITNFTFSGIAVSKIYGRQESSRILSSWSSRLGLNQRELSSHSTGRTRIDEGSVRDSKGESSRAESFSQSSCADMAELSPEVKESLPERLKRNLEAKAEYKESSSSERQINPESLFADKRLKKAKPASLDYERQMQSVISYSIGSFG